jgi:C4-dicarboxylate transporter DctQ subunit
MKFLWNVFDRTVDGMAVLSGAVLLFINAAVCYAIAMRYFFSNPPIWVTQTTEYALLWIVFLATTWLLREKGHVNVDIVYSHLGDGTKRALDAIMYSIAGLACGVVFVCSVLYVQDCYINGVTDVRAVTVPKWTVFAIIPLGSLFLTVQLFRMAWCRAAASCAEGGE